MPAITPLSQPPCAPAEVDEFLSRPSKALVSAVAGWRGPFLVLGAGGKMGLHLAAMLKRALVAAGKTDQVTAVSRFSSLRDRSEFEDAGVATMACDLSDPAALSQLPDAREVFFMAGVKFGTAEAPELLQRMNVEMPRLVAARYRDARIAAFSTGCVYPFVSPASGGASEAVPVSVASGAYAASCIAREQAFSEVSLRHGTRVALIRLNYSVEFRYGLLVDIAQKVWRGQSVDVTTGYVNVIWQTDAVEQSLRALELADSPSVPVNVTGQEILSVRALAEDFGVLLGKPAIVTGREAPTAWLNDARKTHARFGCPKTSTATMQRWIASWIKQGGATWNKPTGFERRDGKF